MDYKKILEGVVDIINTTEKSDIGFANICTYIGENCPELKEFEDERIRNCIRICLTDVNEQRFKDYGTTLKDCFAWLEKQGTPAKLSEEEQNKFAKGVLTSCALCEYIENAFHNAMWDRLHRYYCKYIEKQGEQKPTIEMITPEESLGIDSETYNKIVDECIYADKVEPKFHEGDWVVTSYGKANQVITVDKDGDGFTLDDDTYFSGSWIDGYHLWSIADAKDGDVLASELCESIILFRGIKDDNIDFYCDYDFSKIDIPGDRFAVNNGQHYGNIEDSEDFHPATQEQHNTFFSKMKESGYEWDAEKKELKKIEQKSQRMISAEAKEAVYDKPAWSEDDKDVINHLIDICKSAKKFIQFGSCSREDIIKCQNWLTFLKERI